MFVFCPRNRYGLRATGLGYETKMPPIYQGVLLQKEPLRFALRLGYPNSMYFFDLGLTHGKSSDLKIQKNFATHYPGKDFCFLK